MHWERLYYAFYYTLSTENYMLELFCMLYKWNLR